MSSEKSLEYFEICSNIYRMLLIAEKVKELYLLEDLATQVDQVHQDHPTIKTHVRQIS